MRPVGLASPCQLRFSILPLCVARRLEADPGGLALLGSRAVIDFLLERNAASQSRPCIDAPCALAPSLEAVWPVHAPLFPQAKLRVSTLLSLSSI